MTSAPITADAATIKTLGVGKSFTVSGKKVTKLDSKEKKVVSVSIKKGKVTVKGKKAGQVSFKIGNKTYNVNVGATKVTATAAATTLKVNDKTTVAIKATNGAKDKLTIKTSKSSVVKIGKSSVTADKNGKASVTLRGLAAGTSTITVKSANTGMYAKVKITVKADETATAAPSSDAPATLAPATDAPVGPTVVPTSGGAVTTAPTSGGAVTAAPTATPTTPATVATLSAVTASAISTNKIAFTFNRTVTASAIKAENILVSEATERKFVKSVTASTTANTIELQLFDNLTTGKDYTVTVPVDGVNYSLSFKFVQGEAAKIIVGNQVIPAGVETAIAYKVVDANGLDITNAAVVTFASDKDASKKTLTLSDKEVAFVKATVTLTNGQNVTSDQFTVTGQARVAKALTNYTVSDQASPVDFTATSYKQVLTVQKTKMDKQIYTEIKDQFDKVIEGTTYESLNTDVVIVDKTKGYIIPLAEGSAPVKITNGTFSQTILINVVADATVQDLVFGKDALTFYKGLSKSTEDVTVQTIDQYGVKENVTNGQVKVLNDTNNILNKEAIEGQSISAGSMTITTAVDAGKVKTAGVAVVQVTSGTKTKNLVITVSEVGTTVGYDVAGLKTSLDVNATAVNKNNSAKLTVNPIDANGKISGDDQNFNYTIVEDGNETIKISGSNQASLTMVVTQNTELKNTAETITVFNDSDTILGPGVVSLAPKKTYTVSIKINDLTVKEFKVSTVDTRTAPTVTLAKTKITLDRAAIQGDAGSGLYTVDALAAALQANGVLNVDSKYKLSDLEFISANSSVIKTPNATSNDVEPTGSADIILKSVKAEDISGNVFVIKLSGTVGLTFAADTVKPYIAGVSIASDRKTVTIQFSEMMNKTAAEVETNYTFSDSINAPINPSEAVYNEATMSVVLTFASPLAATGNLVLGSAIEDLAETSNKIDASKPNTIKYTYTDATNYKIEAADLVAPTYTSTGVSATEIKLEFSEKVSTTASNADLKTAFAVSGTESTITSVSLSADGKTLTIGGTAFASGTKLAYTADTGLLKDQAGNSVEDVDAATLNAWLE